MLFNNIQPNTYSSQPLLPTASAFPLRGNTKPHTPEVNIPTLLPPNPSGSNNIESPENKTTSFSPFSHLMDKMKGKKNKYATSMGEDKYATSTADKYPASSGRNNHATPFQEMKSYFARLGKALVGRDNNQQHNKNTFVTPTMLSAKTEEDRESNSKEDPTVGRWPSTFAAPTPLAPLTARKEQYTDSNTLETKANKQFMANNSNDDSFPSSLGGDDFSDVMGQLNSSQDSQKAIMELMKNAASSVGGAEGLGGGLF